MGRSYDLKDGTTTVGRVDDNGLQIAEPSVSSHHGEIIINGNSVIIRDLNSTNGTFINGQQITTEAPLAPGQVLRLGQIELRLETGTASASAPAPRPSAPAASSKSAPKKLPDQTMVIPQGVKLGQDHPGKAPFENTAFSKKNNMGTKVFIGAAVAIGVIVVGLILFHMLSSGGAN
jgi:pSer/pThr/pTyr-binding forkhead associated (FHA) protein